MTPIIMKLEPTIYIDDIPELAAEHQRLEDCSECSREGARRTASGPIIIV